MRGNTFASLIVVLVVVLIVVGFMRGWFTFTSAQHPGGKVNLELSIDPNQAQQDAEKVQRRTDEFFDKVQSEATSDATSRP